MAVIEAQPRRANDASPDTPPMWHQLDAADTLALLDSSVEGLATGDAEARLESSGPNEIEHGSTKHPLRILWEQISAVMVLILIAAALLSVALGKLLEAGAIGGIVILFAALGFLQEYRAEQAIAALRRMSVPVVRVLRNGRVTEAESVSLVPGDVVVLEAGSIVPADMRLIEAANLRIQEAALTGESEPVDKHTEAVHAEDLALGDRRCMAYSGTLVTYGRGSGVVVATGMATELGTIATLLQHVASEQTPLQRRLDKVGKQLAAAGFVVAGLVVAMGAVAGETFSQLVLTAISVAVAVIPEGLPAVVTFTLAIGAKRMLRREALIRKLPAVETLGSVTVICSDKTGTLTQNVMTVTMIDVAGHRLEGDELDSADGDQQAAGITLIGAVLCNNGSIEASDDDVSLVGDPTETALLMAAHRSGVDVAAARQAMPRLAEQPFDSDRKRMSTVHGPIDHGVSALATLPQDRPIVFVKGAVDRLLDLSTQVHLGSEVAELDRTWRDRITAANDEMAGRGMRVLGVAYRTIDVQPHDDMGDVERDLVITGLVGIIDPPRDEVREAVARCRTAGIRPIMITGDHPLTAKAIGRDIGIIDGDDATMTGSELDRLSDDELDEAVRRVGVFARVSPEHKLRIVTTLQSQGHIVAMTGDGVNDAPALRRADIGVAMGITGTDVSKEASDMVLRDDNFATIVAAVEEGRVIYDNLRRFVSFAVAGNLGKIIVMLGWPVPFLIAGGDIDAAVALLPLQLLWLNLMTDGLLGLSMGVEPAEQGVMCRDPHQPGASLWTGGLGSRTLWIGTLIGVVSLGIGFAYEASGRPQWQTMIFTTLAFMQVGQAIGSRSNTDSLRTIGLTTNPIMLVIAVLVIGLQLAAVYTPLRSLLDLEPLDAGDLALCVAAGGLLLGTMEAAKAWNRRTSNRPPR